MWFPKWPIQRLRNARPELRRSELVLFANHNQRPWVTACGPKAERLGVRAGQPLAEAKALLRRAIFLPADVAADREALCQLALDGQRFSPVVGLEEEIPPESLLSDVTGCTHLWDGEEPFLQAVRDHWTERGFQIQLALAGTMGTAWAVAYALRVAVVPAGGETAALSGLPVTLLRLPINALERLEALGLRTIGDVLQLPRETLGQSVWLDLAATAGPGTRPASGIVPRRAATRAARGRAANGKCRWKIASPWLKSAARCCGPCFPSAIILAWVFKNWKAKLRTQVDAVKLEIRLVAPSRDERHLAQLVELHLERCTWSQGIIGIKWIVLRLGSLALVQGNWFAAEGEPDTSREVVALVERLSSRLGDDVVLRVEELPDAQPECAVQLTPWTQARPTDASEFSLPPEQSRGRPFRLLSIPQPIVVVSVVPDGPPIRITWQTQECRVVRCWGPGRIATGWGGARDIERDYYRAEWKDGTNDDLSRSARRSLVSARLLRVTSHAGTPTRQALCPAPVSDLLPRATSSVRYVELHCKTNFSFLEGASHPDELVNQSTMLGYAGLAITDRNSVAGVVRPMSRRRKRASSSSSEPK